MRIDENLGSVGYDNLINSVYPPTEVFGVQLAPGQGVLERGTLLASGENGMLMIGTETTGKANAVLAETVDTGESEPVTVIAYRTGHFNANCLIVAEGYEITATDKETLRTVGILLSDAMEI